MKNQLASLILLLITIPTIIYGQTPCGGSHKEYYLNANKIKATFLPGGNKFYNNTKPGFLVPYPGPENTSSIYASSPWIGGLDDAGNLKVAAETFPNIHLNDFFSGPLTFIGLPYDIPCWHFDRVWNTYGDEIRHHRQDSWDGIIDDTIATIFGWPGKGNPFFEQYNGFPLPADVTLAPFSDENGNGIYEPHLGDYPEIRFNYNYYIPDQILWTVFHDAGPHQQTGGDPLRFEIQLTAFAFNCQDNELLNNTIFNSYKIINRAITSADSLFFGMWTDYDLGCSSDDYIGSDSLRNTEFVYNADNIDGDTGGAHCATVPSTYAEHPPVQSLTYLSHPMHSFIGHDTFTFGPSEFYRLLNGIWPDGTLMVPEKHGHVPGSELAPTKFLYNEDPRDSSAWAAINLSGEKNYTMTISSVKLERLDPGHSTVVDLAYMFHRDTNVDHLGQIGVMYNNVDSLISSMYDLDQNCLPFPSCFGKECVWPGDFDHNGIADHHDLLTWGLMKDKAGKKRNGLITWKAHHADNWIDTTLTGVNFKHGDGTGNGKTDADDLLALEENFLKTNPYYEPQSLYPEGPEIILRSDPMMPSGTIRNIRVLTGVPVKDVFGMAFELEFDTALYYMVSSEHYTCPDAFEVECFFRGSAHYPPAYPITSRYSFVKTDHTTLDIEEGFRLYRSFFGLRLKPGIEFNDLPDTIIVRLKNLIAIDSAGNDLYIGSNQLVLLKSMTTTVEEAFLPSFSIYPNPANDQLFFDVEKETDIRVFSSQGHLVDKFIVQPHMAADISGYSPGVYFLKAVETGHVVRLVIF